MNITEKALIFAVQRHRFQQRKYNLGSYATHVIEVAQLYDQFYGTFNAATAACYLHDVIEDCGVGADLLKTLFGDLVVKYVVELTEVKVEGNRATRKKAEVERISGISLVGKQIKLCDLLSNADGIPKTEAFWPTFREETLDLLKVLPIDGAAAMLHQKVMQ